MRDSKAMIGGGIRRRRDHVKVVSSHGGFYEGGESGCGGGRERIADEADVEGDGDGERQ